MYYSLHIGYEIGERIIVEGPAILRTLSASVREALTTILLILAPPTGLFRISSYVVFVIVFVIVVQLS